MISESCDSGQTHNNQSTSLNMINEQRTTFAHLQVDTVSVSLIAHPSKTDYATSIQLMTLTL